MQIDRVINTKVLPGFMELDPKDQILFNQIKATIEETYKSFGFIPVETPVIERLEVLLAKSGGDTEKQIYRIDKGSKKTALRFDLTIPLSRYVSEHFNDLVFPFRGYQIAKVYRGESPQKGRYREFYQCDIDIIGNGELSLINDAEILNVIYTVFSKLNYGEFVIKINNRKLIGGLLESLGVSNLLIEIVRIIDKIDKIGKDDVSELIQGLGVSKDITDQIFKFLNIQGSTIEILNTLENYNIQNESFKMGVRDLSRVVKSLGVLSVPNSSYKIDLTISRGLDYYTGTVYETLLSEYPQIGSVCSGGRYDNLGEGYSKRKLPGVGMSIGFTRLFSALRDAGILKRGVGTTTEVLIIPIIENLNIPLSIASSLRLADINTEVYCEYVKMKSKLSYANKLGIPYVLLIGEDEIVSEKYTLKNMTSGEQSKLSIGEILSYLKIQLK